MLGIKDPLEGCDELCRDLLDSFSILLLHLLLKESFVQDLVDLSSRLFIWTFLQGVLLGRSLTRLLLSQIFETCLVVNELVLSLQLLLLLDDLLGIEGVIEIWLDLIWF